MVSTGSGSGIVRRLRRRCAVAAAAATAIVVALASVLLLTTGPAAATWSIVAVEEETGRVGVAMASCIAAGVLGEPDQALVPVVLAPGIGAAVTQGTINPESPVGMRQLLNDGAASRQAIDALLEIDEQSTARQFAVVLLPVAQGDGTVDVAAFTGQDVEPERGDRTGPAVSVQGVLLADQAVLDRSLSAYGQALADGRSFEEALVDGLVAGSDAGGDRRCDEQTALFAHLAVAAPGDDPLQPSTLVTVTVDEGDGQNPVPELATAVAAGRSGWIDLGLNDPATIPRVAVLAVGTLLALAAFFVLRKGMGSPSARR